MYIKQIVILNIIKTKLKNFNSELYYKFVAVLYDFFGDKGLDMHKCNRENYLKCDCWFPSEFVSCF